MRKVYSAWSLNLEIFSINQSAEALQMPCHEIRTLIQVFDEFFDRDLQESQILEPTRFLSFWDNLAVSLLANDFRHTPRDSVLFNDLFDEISILLPEESSRIATIEKSKLYREVGSILGAFPKRTSIEAWIEIGFLSKIVVNTFLALDSYVQTVSAK